MATTLTVGVRVTLTEGLAITESEKVASVSNGLRVALETALEAYKLGGTIRIETVGTDESGAKVTKRSDVRVELSDEYAFGDFSQT